MLINNREPVKTNHQSSLSDGIYCDIYCNFKPTVYRSSLNVIGAETCTHTHAPSLDNFVSCNTFAMWPKSHRIRMEKRLSNSSPVFSSRSEMRARRRIDPTKHNHIHGCSRVPMMVFSTRLSTFGCNLNRARAWWKPPSVDKNFAHAFRVVWWMSECAACLAGVIDRRRVCVRAARRWWLIIWLLFCCCRRLPAATPSAVFSTFAAAPLYSAA